jgi:hypothetical protein
MVAMNEKQRGRWNTRRGVESGVESGVQLHKSSAELLSKQRLAARTAVCRS